MEWNVCPLCQEQSKCAWNHIIARCQRVEKLREEMMEVLRENGMGWTQDKWSCELLKYDDKRIAAAVGSIIRDWTGMREAAKEK
jgi:hypothetical protein